MFVIDRSWYALKKTKRKGRGVIARHAIPAGTVIGDYLGKIAHPMNENEIRDGLYTLGGGKRYDIFGDPKVMGVHLINHSCANNCTMYPFGSHTLYVALRRIFPGEELTVDYRLGIADEKKIACKYHACHCGAKICTGSMHDAEVMDAVWERFARAERQAWYLKMPGPFGSELPPLASYPHAVPLDQKMARYHFTALGTESKPPFICRDAALPSFDILRERIRATGRRLSFPRLGIMVYGLKSEMLIAEPLVGVRR